MTAITIGDVADDVGAVHCCACLVPISFVGQADSRSTLGGRSIMTEGAMLRDYFGEIVDGRLARRRFVFLWLFLLALFIGFGALIGVSIGIAEHLVGGDLKTAQQMLREKLAVPAVLAIAIFLLAFVFAKLNIIAKRARDAGLPGWITAIVIAGLIGTASQLANSAATSGGVGMLLLIVLAFVPANQFRKSL